MNIQQVKIWNCANGKCIAVNPFAGFENEWPDYEIWLRNPENQPSTELTGTYSGDEVEIKEMWEIRHWLHGLEQFSNWRMSTKEFCQSINDSTTETRQSFQLIAKPVSKEALQGESKEHEYMTIIDQVRTQVEDCHDYVSDFFIKVAGDFEGKFPHVEVQDFTNSETRLSCLKLHDKTEAYVIEKRTELNHVEFTFISKQEYASQQTGPLIKALEELQQEKWISVKDRLPEKSQHISGCRTLLNGEKYVIPAFWSNSDKVFWADTQPIDLTHWQPLPSPPSSLNSEDFLKGMKK